MFNFLLNFKRRKVSRQMPSISVWDLSAAVLGNQKSVSDQQFQETTDSCGKGWVEIELRFIDINMIFAFKTTVTRPEAQVEPAQELVYCQVNGGFGPRVFDPGLNSSGNRISILLMSLFHSPAQLTVRNYFLTFSLHFPSISHSISLNYTPNVLLIAFLFLLVCTPFLCLQTVTVLY